jgi:hypothetical protein
MIIMMVIFALTLVTLKLIMTSKSSDGAGDGDGRDTGDGANPGFESADSSFFGGGSHGGDAGLGMDGSSFCEGGDGPDAGEPMLDDFKSEDLMGYEVSDDAGHVYETDDLVGELYRSEGTFSKSAVTFSNPSQTFSEDEL